MISTLAVLPVTLQMSPEKDDSLSSCKEPEHFVILHILQVGEAAANTLKLSCANVTVGNIIPESLLHVSPSVFCIATYGEVKIKSKQNAHYLLCQAP
jgi:hypothetical protein